MLDVTKYLCFMLSVVYFLRSKKVQLVVGRLPSSIFTTCYFMGRRWRGAMFPLQGNLAGSTPNVSTYFLSPSFIRTLLWAKGTVR